MALITIEELSIGFRGPALLDEVNCQIEPGQKIGLLGRNGAGKTTFMRILCGEVEPDHGQVQFAPQTKVALLPQDVPQDKVGRVFDIVSEGFQTIIAPAGRIEVPEWEQHLAVEQFLSRMNLDGESAFETLSSGMKRRVLLAHCLVTTPDLLLLDEPTNHLDIDAITWLEDFLLRWNAALIFVTHDRMFLQRMASRILEIDRGRLFDWSCDYETFLKRKEQALESEEKQNALFDKRLAEEEVWIRQGIKARRTRNEGRVRALKKMRVERSERRSKQSQVNLKIDAGVRSGNLVAEAKQISFAYDDLDIVRDFTTTIMRGDKVGLIGPNGVGKTTLLRVLLGQLKPQQGHVRLGTNLQIAYFDQLRDQLDGEQTVQENVGEGSDTIKIGGQTKHVIGYLQDFLFSPERARTPVRFLSGGERNRVLLAKLFSKPANVIVLDEPTNDLDTETLEMLEERLMEYDGTLLLVSHDRAFLNNVVTSTIAFEPSETDQNMMRVKEYDGGYDDWLRQRPELAAEDARKAAAAQKNGSSSDSSPSTRQQPMSSDAAAATLDSPKRKLSYNEQQELKKLPATIEDLEGKISALHEKMAAADYYQRPGDELAADQATLKELDDQLSTAFVRWEELEPHG